MDYHDLIRNEKWVIITLMLDICLDTSVASISGSVNCDDALQSLLPIVYYIVGCLLVWLLYKIYVGKMDAIHIIKQLLLDKTCDKRVSKLIIRICIKMHICI